MSTSVQSFSPTYKLIIGMPGTSNALKIAKRLGLGTDIVDVAQKNLSGEKISFEKLLQQAEHIRQQASMEFENIQKVKNAISVEKIETSPDVVKVYAEDLFLRRVGETYYLNEFDKYLILLLSF